MSGQLMKITDVKTQIVNQNFRNAVIVEVETDEGITGIAETVMKRKTHTVERSILESAPLIARCGTFSAKSADYRSINFSVVLHAREY